MHAETAKFTITNVSESLEKLSWKRFWVWRVISGFQHGANQICAILISLDFTRHTTVVSYWRFWTPRSSRDVGKKLQFYAA